MKRIIFFCILLSIILTGCTTENTPSESKLEQIDLVLDWVPNTNHTGIYVAKELGYFEEEGLSVNIIQPAEGGAESVVGIGNAPFGVSYQENVTMARASKTPIPVVAIAAINQHNTTGYGAAADRNIKSPKDFEGKNFKSFGSQIELKLLEYVMKKNNADFSKINLISDNSTDFFTALDNGIDISWIFEGWDVVVAQDKGVDLDFFPLIDYGIDFYTPVIISSEDYLKDNKETTKKFLRAVSKGYKYCVDNPDESAEILVKNVPELDINLIKKSQKYLSTKYMEGTSTWGLMSDEIWSNFTGFLLDNGILEKNIDIKNAYTNEFLSE